MFNIVLMQPEIPQNTGNIIRTCACTGCSLHLVKPLGFSLSDKHYKRAGLDYFDKSRIYLYDDVNCFLEINKNARMFFLTTKAHKIYTQPEYKAQDFFVFGRESAGISEVLLKERYDNAIRIPMMTNLRSLNLANSVSIVVYEALRQHNFDCMGMQLYGDLTGRCE